MSVRRWLLVLVVMVGLVSAVGLYALPELVRRVAIARVHAMTNRPVAIDRVEVALLGGRVAIHGFRLAERDGAAPFAHFDRLDLRIHLVSLVRGHVWIRDMVLTAPFVRVVREDDGEFNFSDLLGATDRAERGRMDVTVDRFTLEAGTVVLEDRALAEPRTWKSEEIQIHAENVSTRRGDGTAVGRSVTAGAPTAVTVRNLRLYPIHLDATMSVQGLDLTLAQVYLPPNSIVVDRGRATGDVTVSLDAREGLHAGLRGQFEDVALLAPDGHDTLAVVPRLTTRVNDFVVHDGGMRLGHLAAEGSLSVRDPMRPGRFQRAHTRATIANLTWPATAAGQVDVLATVEGGGRLAVTGAVRPPPAASQLRLRVSRLDLAPWAQFLPLEGRVSGVAEADLRTNEPLAPGVPARLEGSVAVNHLAVADARRPLVTMQRIEATGLELQLPTRAMVDRIVLTSPRAIVERDPNGSFPVVSLLGRPAESGRAAAATPRTEAPSPAALSTDIGEIVVRNGAVSWRDATVSPAAQLEVAAIAGRVTGIGWPLRGAAHVALAARPPGGGHVAVRGRVDLDPVAADLRIVTRDAELAPYQPYLPATARVSGAADLDLAVSVPSLADQRGTARGRVGLVRVDVRDTERTMMRVERAVATGVDVDWPDRVAVNRLALIQPWLLLERDRTGALSLLTVLPRPAEPTATEQSAAPPPHTNDETSPVAITVGDLRIERAGVRIVDQSVSPAFAVDLQPATVQARGLSTNEARPARFDVQGQLGPGAAVALRGTLGPLRGPLRLDVAGEVREFAVPRANPYVLQQAGWRTTDGRLTSVLQARIDGDALSAKTDIRISRLQVVRATADDGAQGGIGLPLGLLTSLMKDRKGDIHVSFPVGGRLSDPKFDFSDAIWSAVRTVAVNAIALPVSWIGRVRFSPDSRIEGIEVDPIPFGTGTAEPTPEGHARLARLAAFLERLPAVTMTMTPIISAADIDELARGERQAAASPASADQAPAAFPREDAPVHGLARERLETLRSMVRQAGIDPARLQAQKPVETPDAVGQVALGVAEPDTPRPSRVRETVDRVRDRLTGDVRE